MVLFAREVTSLARNFARKAMLSSLRRSSFADPIPVVPAAYLIDHSGKAVDVITLKNAPDETVFSNRLHDAVSVSCWGFARSLCNFCIFLLKSWYLCFTAVV